MVKIQLRKKSLFTTTFAKSKKKKLHKNKKKEKKKKSISQFLRHLTLEFCEKELEQIYVNKKPKSLLV